MIPHRSRRCPRCDIHWPPSKDSFDPCPECGGLTHCSQVFPMALDEAFSRKHHADFKAWCEEHERQEVAEHEAIPTAAGEGEG